MKRDLLFFNVDTQKDFCQKNGKLYIKGAESIYPTLAKVTNAARVQDMVVVNTADFHTPDDIELSKTPDFINTFPEHCMVGTEGCNFIDETNFHKFGCDPYYISNYDEELDKEELMKCRNIIIYKNKFDVFEGNKNTEAIIKELNPKMIMVYGVATNVCVNAAVIGLATRGHKVTVIGNAIKELPNISIDSILEKWYRLGVNIKFI